MPKKDTIQNLINNYKEFSEKTFDKIDLELAFEQWGQIHQEAEELFAQIYIAYTCDTADPEKLNLLNEITLAQEQFTFFYHQIAEKMIDQYQNFPQKFEYAFKILANEQQLFHKENLPLETQIQNLSQEYQSITGALTVEHNGEEKPLSLLKPFLESHEQNQRQEAFIKIRERYYQEHNNIDSLFNKQIELRHKTASNCGFANFRDYMHQAKNRFSYTPSDCLEFSQNILKYIVPVASELALKRKKSLGLDSLMPFDMGVDINNQPALKVASSDDEFIQKALTTLEKVDIKVAQTLSSLKEKNNLDLFARKNKAPGGYNFPLSVSKSSFIFMNCAFTHTDMQTLIHETGHAYHFDCYKNNNQAFLYQSPPSEVAELASMGMELMSMEHWDHLYSDPDELQRARFQQLEHIIYFFPWMAVVDSFQHWVYTNPDKSIQERNSYFMDLYQQYHPYLNWEEYKHLLPTLWHKQLHIIEVPFYYVEYGIAQLGALQLWKNYKNNPSQTFQDYSNALNLGSSQMMDAVYEKANIKMDFSSTMIQNIAEFLKHEIGL